MDFPLAQLFCLIGNCVAFPIKQKALRGMRTRAKKKYVASDRARRENVPRHILFCVDRTAEQDSIYNFQLTTCSRPRMKRR